MHFDVVSLYHWNFHRLRYFYSYLRNGAGVIDLAVEEGSVILSIHVQKSLMCKNFGFIDLRCFPCVIQ